MFQTTNQISYLKHYQSLSIPIKNKNKIFINLMYFAGDG